MKIWKERIPNKRNSASFELHHYMILKWESTWRNLGMLGPCGWNGVIKEESNRRKANSP